MTINDVNIFNTSYVDRYEVVFTIIYNNDTGMHIKRINSSIPVRVDRIDTFSIQDVIPAFKLPKLRIQSFRSLLIALRNGLVNFISDITKPREFDGSVIFDVRNIVPNNIGHLMLHIIPLCLHVKKHSKLPVIFIFDKVRQPFLHLLLIFGIKPKFTTSKIKGQIAKIYSVRGLAAHQIIDLFDCTPYSFLPDIYDEYSFKNGSSNNKIFFARRGPRGLKNLAEIEILLSDYGYKTIFMEDYSIEDQLAIAFNANEIVGVHGASMAMLTLRKSMKSIIEIMPPNVYHDYYPVSFGKKVERYVQVMPYFDERIPYNGWSAILGFKNNAFSADINLLKKALEIVHF